MSTCLVSFACVLLFFPQSPGRAFLTANPNPVPGNRELAPTTIAWDTGDGSIGHVLVSVDDAPEAEMAVGTSGTVSAPWIARNVQYRFTLYVARGNERTRLVSVTVVRDRRWTRQQRFTVYSVGMLLVASCLWVYWRVHLRAD